jgi:DNA polymerase I
MRQSTSAIDLKRAREQDLAVHPGQDIEYVVVDDEKTSRDRVALAHEDIESTIHPTTKPGLSVPSRAFFRRSGGIERISAKNLVRHES